jgi:hypothetical protein
MNNVTRYEFEVYEGGGEVVVSETGCFVDYDDYLSQLQQTDALQTSLNNIINAFGIKGEVAHSKLVIEYVHGLVAENEALKQAIPKPKEIDFHDDRLDDVSVAEQVGFNQAISKITKSMQETPNTNAFTAELRAQGVDSLSLHMELNGYSNEASGARAFAANLRAGRKG